MVEVARRLCEDNQIYVAEIWSYHTVGDQVRFTLVHRSRQAPPPRAVKPPKPAPKAAAPKAAAPKAAAPKAPAPKKKPAEKKSSTTKKPKPAAKKRKK
jgi:hypothetical protein